MTDETNEPGTDAAPVEATPDTFTQAEWACIDALDAIVTVLAIENPRRALALTKEFARRHAAVMSAHPTLRAQHQHPMVLSHLAMRSLASGASPSPATEDKPLVTDISFGAGAVLQFPARRKRPLDPDDDDGGKPAA